MGRCNSPNIKYSTINHNKLTRQAKIRCVIMHVMCMCFPADLNSMPQQILSLTFDKVKDTRDWSLVTTGTTTWQKIPCTSFFLSRSSTYPADEPQNSKRLEMPLSCQRNGLCFSRSQRVSNIHCCRLKKQQEWQERTRWGFLKLTVAYGKFCGLPLIAKTLCLIEMTWRTFPGRRPRERINLSHTVSQPGAVSFNFIHNAYPPTQRFVPYAGNWGTSVNCKQNYICPFSSFHQDIYIYIDR